MTIHSESCINIIEVSEKKEKMTKFDEKEYHRQCDLATLKANEHLSDSDVDAGISYWNSKYENTDAYTMSAGYLKKAHTFENIKMLRKEYS